MNPHDPESAQRIVVEYAGVVERHAEAKVHPAPARTLPYPKQTIKAAILTCVQTLQRTGQLTEDVRGFLEDGYVRLAEYLDDELVRVMTEYREASAALADVASARDRTQTAAWQRLAGTGRLAGQIAQRIAEDTRTLRQEFHAAAHGGPSHPAFAQPLEERDEHFDL